MMLVRICVLAAFTLAVETGSGEENPRFLPPGSTAPAAGTSQAAPLAGAAGRSPGQPELAPVISAADALELAKWARDQAARGGGNGQTAPISLEDARELEAWARQQAEREAILPAAGIDVGTPQAGSPGAAAAPPAAVTASLPRGSAPFSVLAFQPPPGYYPPGFRGPVASPAAPGVPSGPVAPTPAAPQAMPQEGAANGPASGEAAGQPEEIPGPLAADTKPGCAECGGDCLWGCCWRQWCEAGLVGGVELAFLGPLGEPSQAVTQTNLITGESFTGTTEAGLASSVRVWLGVQHAGGFGYRARYGHLGADYINLDPVVPVIVDGQTAFREEYYLCGDTVDLELTSRYCLHNWVLDASLGARYARLVRNAMSLGYGELGQVELTGLAVGANQLEGAGFTFSVGGNAPVGLWWAKHHAGDDPSKPHPPFDDIHSRIVSCAPNLLCGWRWFWGVRGSFLWADTAASAFTEANAVVRTPTGTGSSYSRDQAFAAQDQDDNVIIGEVVAGLQWEHCCACLPAVFFFRAGLEYQHWETGDVCATSNSFAYLHDGPNDVGGRVDAVANAHDGDLDLFGFMIGAGVTY